MNWKNAPAKSSEIPFSFNRLIIRSLSCRPSDSGRTVACDTTSASTSPLSNPCKASTALDGASGSSGRGNEGKAGKSSGSCSGPAISTSTSTGGSTSSGVSSAGSSGVSCLRRFFGGFGDSECCGDFSPVLGSSSTSLSVSAVGFVAVCGRILRLSFLRLRYRCFAFVFCCHRETRMWARQNMYLCGRNLLGFHDGIVETCLLMADSHDYGVARPHVVLATNAQSKSCFAPSWTPKSSCRKWQSTFLNHCPLRFPHGASISLSSSKACSFRL